MDTADLATLNPGPAQHSNLFVPSIAKPDGQFEKYYLLARNRENRVYSDEEVRQLPSIPAHHPHYREWRLRRRSCAKLVRYLESKKRLLSILEIGCGNGWFAYQLSRIPGSKVIGLDVNLPELQQAARVFDRNSKLKFVYGDIRSGILYDLRFDVIVFAASIQYFPALKEVADIALRQLYSDGEIHILDSHFYSAAALPAAQERTKQYYDLLGVPEMAAHYYQHGITELAAYRHEVLHDPQSLWNRFFKGNPFHWICLKNE